MAVILTALLLVISVFIISALPLFFAVKFLGGKTKLWKTVIINVLIGLIISLINAILPLFGVLIGFVAMLFLYKYFFRISLGRAFIVWIVEMVLIGIFWLIGTLIGISLLTGAILL